MTGKRWFESLQRPRRAQRRQTQRLLSPRVTFNSAAGLTDGHAEEEEEEEEERA